MTTNPPPEHLGDAGRALWARITGEFDVSDAGGRALLQTCCEAADRCAAAQEALRREGMTTTDARGSVKAHPLLAVEASAWNAIRAGLRQLRIDTDPTPARPAGRPATRR